MDRHVRWLRRRIVTSVATQTAATFAVVAIVLFIILRVATDAGLFGVLFASVVIAQIVALGRLVLSMRSNPLNYSFMKKSVEEPFTHQVSRFQGVEVAHAVAGQLPGFAPVATIRDAHGNSGPIFDVYHDPSRLVAASVSRSGALSLLSSLKGGRVLVTSAAGLPPHERRVMNVAAEDSVDGIIASHRVALSKQGDVTKLDESAHQVVLDSLALEYASYSQLGPAVSSFLDLESSGRSWRVTVPVDADELAELPERLGSSSLETQTPDAAANGPELDEIRDVTRITYAATQQDAPPATQVVETDTGEALVIPEVIAPQIAPEDAAAPTPTAVVVPSSEVPPAEIPAFTVPPVVAPSSEMPSSDVSPVETAGELATSVTPSAGDPSGDSAGAVSHTIDGILSGDSDSSASELAATVTPAAPEPEVAPDKTSAVAAETSEAAPKIGPTPFVTAEPDTIDERDSAEPITAEVPAIAFTDAPVSEDLSTTDVAAQAKPVESDDDQDDDRDSTAGEASDEADSDADFAALPAALGGSVDKATLTARQAPVNSPQLVNRVLSSLRSLGANGEPVESADEEEDDRPASLAEAIVSAPDTAVALTGATVDAGAHSLSQSAVSESAVSESPVSESPVSESAVSESPVSESPVSESAASAVAPAASNPTGSVTTVVTMASSMTDSTSTLDATAEASAPLPVARHEMPELLASTSRRPKLSAALKATRPETVAPSSKRTRRKR